MRRAHLSGGLGQSVTTFRGSRGSGYRLLPKHLSEYLFDLTQLIWRGPADLPRGPGSLPRCAGAAQEHEQSQSCPTTLGTSARACGEQANGGVLHLYGLPVI